AGAAPALALHAPVHPHPVELCPDPEQAAADHPPVGLELGLARAPRPDAAAEALQVAPLPDEPGQQVRELGELHLELALARAGALGEDVQDEGRPVDDPEAERLREVALLDARQRVVADW